MKINIFGRASGGASSPWTDPLRLEALVQGREKPEGGAHHIIDVRSAQEYATGHIPTAVNIPVREIGPRLPPADKDALIVVYCLSGSRSEQAQRVLEGLGYRNVVNFGAVSRWPGELVRGDTAG